ncbi:MAG: hypothetical protein IT440_01040 [Phycisphaeraceae bacterium]|nr:hypothetical protein [Phycisphaeraceae bacterium]
MVLVRYGLVALTLLVSCAALSLAQTPAPAVTTDAVKGTESTENTFVRGVYFGLAVSGVQVNADEVGKDIPAFLDQLFRDLKQTYHCNVFWSNSGGMPEYIQALDIAARYDLKLFCNVRHMYARQNAPLETEAKIDELARQITDAFKNKKAMGGYVICEEVGQAGVPQMDYMRQRLEMYDPSPAHPTVVSEAGGAGVIYAFRSGFRFMCPQAYFFAAPNAQYCPNTPASSRDAYAGMLDGLCDYSRRTGKIAWIMPQSCAGIHGKYWTDDQGNLVGEPGSYWNVRMPTVAEMHFQTWDAIRSGCRGIIYFLLMPYSHQGWRPDKAVPTEADKQALAEMEKETASYEGRTDLPLLKERFNTGEATTLLQLGGKPTRQSQAMGKDFAAIEKLEPLLVSWKQATFPVAFADRPARVNTFESPLHPGRRFVAVVNYDTASAQPLRVLMAPNAVKVTNLRTGANVPLASVATEPGGLQEVVVPLEAGDGTVLEVAFHDNHPGILTFEEDFYHFGSPVVLENLERVNQSYPFFQGDYWGVRKTGGASSAYVGRASEGIVACAKLTRLQDVPEQNGPLGGSLKMAEQGLCDVFLAVEGKFPKPESLIIQLVNVDGKEGDWLCSDAYFHPVRIPPKDAAGKPVAEIRFILADDALLTHIRCWRVERNK